MYLSNGTKSYNVVIVDTYDTYAFKILQTFNRQI